MAMKIQHIKISGGKMDVIQKTRHEKNKVESHCFRYISKSHND